MSQTPFVITASFPIGDGTLRYVVSLDQSGRTDLILESNEQDPANQAIGVYRTDIGERRAQEARNAWIALKRAPQPSPQIVPPGTPMVLATLEEGGKKEEWLIDPVTSSPAMCRAAEHLRNLGQEALKNPVREFRMHIQADKAEVGQSESVKISVQLTANGVEPVVIADPLPAAAAGSGGITIWGLRSDIPPADLWPFHSNHQLLTPKFLDRSVIPDQSAAKGELVLQPRQSATYEFNIPINWEAGEYAVKIIFETFAGSDKALRGKIVSAPVTLRVKGAS